MKVKKIRKSNSVKVINQGIKTNGIVDRFFTGQVFPEKSRIDSFPYFATFVGKGVVKWSSAESNRP
jgi:hypothetical protein